MRKRGKDVDRLSAGACFGELGYISKRGRTPAVVADEDTTVMKIRFSLVGRTSLGWQLQGHRAFLSTTADRLYRATEIIADWDVE